MAYDQTRDYSHALNDFTHAIALKPDYAVAFYNRGNTQRNLNNNAAAVMDYSRALAIDPAIYEAAVFPC